MILLLLLSLLALLQLGEGCMPGFEREREKLKEYLGIEWIPKGMSKSGIRDGKSIRHSRDLNCNFTRPDLCKWRNAESRMGMDSRDFSLFEKTDFTEWPALQIHPGPTKVDQGDRLLFVGDRTREEQHALFYSAVIPCQSGTGNLSFAYWAYNNARVEVVILEDVNGKPNILPEKPYVNCGTVPVNTLCHAEIPPRNKPFRLGFRAYDIANTEGSFILLDDFRYAASLCNVSGTSFISVTHRTSVDLGDFTSAPLVTSAEGHVIHKASDLLCVNFDLSCRWRSKGQSTTMWRGSASPLPDEFVLMTTGNKIKPSGRYGVLYIEQDATMPYDELRSDPILCQAITNNQLTFRFWTTKGVVLEGCAVSTDGDRIIECHRAPSNLSPAPVKFEFKKASKDFYYAIRVASLNTNVDNVVIIDDISYAATFCNEAISTLDLGSHYVATPMLSVLLGKHISSAKELWCDFSKRASECAWGWVETETEGDPEAPPIEWQIGNGPLDSEKFYSLTGQTVMPHQEFAVVQFKTAGSSLLLSEVLICVVKQATLSFHLWTTGIASLRVCLVEENSPSLLDCQPASAGPVQVELPRVERPFRIALRADSDGEGMVIVDHIQLKGDICGSPRQYAAKSYRPTGPRPDVNVCQLLSCSFTKGHPCLYDSSSLQKSAQFEVRKGILMADLDSTRPIAILESVPFALNTISRFHFEFSIIGDVALFICNDSAGKELENCFKVETNGGEDYVELLPSDTKVYLLARAMATNGKGSIQIKKLTLTDLEDEPAC